MEQKLKRDMRMGDNLRRLRLDHATPKKSYVQNYNDLVVISAEAPTLNMRVVS